MKKDNADYLKELEKFSEYCLFAVRQENTDFDSINELKILTDRLKKEYFTPIEREDIFLLASSLTDLYLSVKRLNSFADKNAVKSDNMTTISNFLYSATNKINEAVKELSKFPKSDIYGLIFEIKRITGKAISFAAQHSDALTEMFKECIRHCEIFTDRIIYIHLKNT